MHEHGICEGLVDLIEQQAAGRKVTGVRLRIGARHAVVDQAFDQAFAMAADGTAAAGAKLDLVVTPMTVTCRACGRHSESTDPLAVCSGCGGSDVDLSGGEEMVLESIVLDGASFDDASLDAASLGGASLGGASLDAASLGGASLDGASLGGAERGRPDVSRDSG